MIETSKTNIDGCFKVKFDHHHDSRGEFVKTFNSDLFKGTPLEYFNLSEEYYSSSKKNVLRGLHFQRPPHDHNKFVYCISGEVTDFFLDIRRNSITYGKLCSVKISSEYNKFNAIFLPKGIAHGFISESEKSVLVYKTDSKYNEKSDDGINWKSFINELSIENPIVSDRDNSFITFDDFISPFN